MPTFNFDEAQTFASMDLVEDFLIETGATLWIEHDFATNALLRKSPASYEEVAQERQDEWVWESGGGRRVLRPPVIGEGRQRLVAC